MQHSSPLSRLLRRRVDPVLEAVMRSVSRRDVRGPLRTWLAPHRSEAMRRALDVYAPRLAPLAGAVQQREPEAIARYDALVGEALDSMRKSRPGEREDGGQRAARDVVLGAIDERLYRDRPELMDDPSFPEDERIESLDLLDRFNRCTGIYETVRESIEPLVAIAERAGRRPVRVHDVASGHGGLALYLAETMGDRVAIEASDIRSEYLDLGRAQAAERGLRVDFSVEDALALDGLARRGVDVITCTQALHHFPPGMIARMMGEAARAAKVGACFVDGERSWLSYGLLALTGVLYGRSYTFLHDATVSIRRMFYEEELALLAALAPAMPEGARIETGIAPPSHVFVRIEGRA
ncbi:class I SAM-dependent methyltransferase [Polyangium aurulentum]|uniref:class I SAM-dependent methyltransferase n=1 Tax=Polyangium aurulentum TaxID=2567896 RepID=UPI0010AE0B28|nr:class I SAM-dependent methyltransferase [Polyangium aurulentum]UQA61585.1 class I SAM-dependent methyltransferase [Polyangium aurulentum]